MHKVLAAAVGLTALAALSVVLVVRSVKPEIVAVGEPVRQDDFLYTVTSVSTKRAHASTVYAVTLRVDSQARRVDYRWSDDNAYVTDDSGRRYVSSTSTADAATDESASPVPPGGTGVFTLDFELPNDARSPMLHYWNGIMMGDVLDGAAYARVAIPLAAR